MKLASWETPKTDFLVTRPISSLILSRRADSCTQTSLEDWYTDISLAVTSKAHYSLVITLWVFDPEIDKGNYPLLCFCGRVPWLYQYWPVGFMLFVVLCPGTPEGSTGSGSGFKASQKTGQRLKVSSDRLGDAGNRTCFVPQIKRILVLLQ